MNFQWAQRKQGSASSIAITSLVYYVPDTILPCQQLAITGLCEFCAWVLAMEACVERYILRHFMTSAQSAQSLRKKKNKRNPFWITSCHKLTSSFTTLMTVPMALALVGRLSLLLHRRRFQPGCQLQGLLPKRPQQQKTERLYTFGGSKPCNGSKSARIIHVGLVNNFWTYPSNSKWTQTLAYQIDGVKKIELWFMKMNKGGGETQWKYWASPEPPRVLNSLLSSLAMAWYLCRKKFQYLSMEAKEGVKCQLRDDHWWYQYMQNIDKAGW